MKRGLSLALALAGGFLAAAPASPQFVPLSRCRAAYPCGFPFGLQYRPEPLIAGQYGNVGNTAISVRVAVQSTFAPEIDKRYSIDEEAVDAAVRMFLRKHPLRLPAPAPALEPERRPPPPGIS